MCFQKKEQFKVQAAIKPEKGGGGQSVDRIWTETASQASLVAILCGFIIWGLDRLSTGMHIHWVVVQ